MTDEEIIENKNSPLVKAYQDKIEMLSKLLDTLEENKRKLDSVVANHEAHKIEYTKDQMLLNEILKDIELKTKLQQEATDAMNLLNSKKFALEQESKELEVSVNKKKEYISDIEKYPSMVKVLQEDMESFQNQHATNKKIAQEELENVRQTSERHISDTKNRLKNLHDSIGALIL